MIRVESVLVGRFCTDSAPLGYRRRSEAFLLITQVYEGTNQVQCIVMARQLLNG